MVAVEPPPMRRRNTWFTAKFMEDKENFLQVGDDMLGLVAETWFLLFMRFPSRIYMRLVQTEAILKRKLRRGVGVM